jgi:hypothetical protein
MASGLSLTITSQKVEHCVIHASLHRWNGAAGKLLAGEIGRGGSISLMMMLVHSRMRGVVQLLQPNQKGISNN